LENNKVRLRLGYAFPFRALGLGPKHFKDSVVHTEKTLPVLLRRRWSEVTAHTVNPSRPSDVSSLFQAALYLDLGTRGMVCVALLNDIKLDKARPVGDAMEAGIKFIATTIEARGRSTGLTVELQTAHEEAAAEIARGMEVEPDTNVKELSEFPDRVQHPLKFYRYKHTADAVLAKAVFPLMSSAAGGERSFNVYGSTHTKKRNRLGADKLDALARVKVNTKTLARKGAPFLDGARAVATLHGLYYDGGIVGEEGLAAQVDNAGNDDNDNNEQ
jgi:hypothetical protein